MINPKFRREDFCKETQMWSDSYIAMPSILPTLDLDDRLRKIEERLLIIAPPNAIISKYPALAEAYSNYKLIEKLTIGNDQT